ncbi:hypothetical protein [Longirhabdus pacifica]|uniref:hypothetical protein n=1 Tax=Longirhabdus pacifica TaxID=2305227 RepID=UPI0013E8DFA0|nr:hypothetical protein [Longirhabdus pacifica]
MGEEYKRLSEEEIKEKVKKKKIKMDGKQYPKIDVVSDKGDILIDNNKNEKK